MNSARQLLLNTAANWVGQLLPPVIALVMVPIYLGHLGMAPYGLIGAFTSLTLLLNIFSQGITQALQREFARRDHDESQRGTMRRLARSFELVYQALGVSFGLMIAASANWITNHWIKDAGGLPADEIRNAIRLLGLRVALAFPYGVYSAIFVGTQRQVLGNAFVIAFGLIGAITSAALVIGTQSLTPLYAGEAVVAACMVFSARRAAYRLLPRENDSIDTPSFSLAEVKALIGLSMGAVWTSGVGVFITQLDRVLLSRLTPLAELAIYNAAVAGGRLIGMIYMPFLTAAFPRTCRLFASGDTKGLAIHVLQNAAVVASLTAAVSMPVVFFSGDLLWLWTREPLIRDAGAPIMAIYSLGSLALSQASVFYALQMAAGRVRPAVIFNASALVWYPSSMFLLVSRLGALGAAWAWFIYGLSCWFFMAASSFRLHLPQKSWLPYLRRTMGPYVITTAVTAITSEAIPQDSVVRAAACVALAITLLPLSLLIAMGPREGVQMICRLRSAKIHRSP